MMADAALLDAICKLLPAQFEALVFKLGAPAEYLSGAQAAQAIRAMDLLRWAAQAGRVEDVRRALREVGGGVAATGSGPRVAIGRLPATGAELFGREADLGWLDAAWREGVNVTSVVAFGGVGKTALVNRWIATLRDRGWEQAERVFDWSFYSGGTGGMGASSDPFIDAALRWFGDADPKAGSAWDKGARLAELVREKKTLLILDGVEPLQWGPGVQAGKFKDPGLEALLKGLAAHNSGLCLVTSRIWLTDLNGLTGKKVRAKDLNALSSEAGAQLLKARGVKGTPQELQAASKEYKRHGLALTLLGSYLTEVAKGDIQRRKEIGPLEEAEEHGGHARRVMRSYEPWLGKTEAAFVKMLGFFDRPADEGEINALRADPIIPGLTDALGGIRGREWNRAITKLRKVGLLLAEDDKRLDAHPLVREHFGEQLKQEKPEAWRAEAAASFAEAERMQAKQEPAYPRLYSLPGFQYCDLLLDEGRDAEVRERAAQTLGWGGMQYSLLDIALDHLSLGRAHLLGARHGTGGDLAQAQDHLRQAVDGLRRGGHQWMLPFGLLARADLHLHHGDLGAARRDLEEALELSTRCAFRLHEVDACLGMARLGLSEPRGGEEKRTEEKRETARAPGTQGSGGERGEEEGQSTSGSQSPLSLLPLAPLAPLAVSSASSSGLTITQVRGYLDRAAALIAQCGYHRRDEALAELREQILRTPRSSEGQAEVGGPGPSLALGVPTLLSAPAALAEDMGTASPRSLSLDPQKSKNEPLKDVGTEGIFAPPRPRAPAFPSSPSPPLPAPPAPQFTHAAMPPEPADIGIVIALPEEFRVLRALAGGDLVPHPDPDLSAYLFQRGAYRCAVTLTGEMGEAQAVLFTDRLIRALDPAVLVSIGIAGGLNDLLAGDVHVPSQAVQYLQDSKAEATADGGFAIVPGAPAYRPDFALHKELLHFEFRHGDAYRRWVADCAADFASLLPDEAKRAELLASKLVGARVQALVDGHVATGPVVGSSRAFSGRVRCHDRQVKSIEMESAAVLLAAQNRSEPRRAIALRGISDFGDEHKKELDRKGDGVLRRYAMRNAVRLLWAMLDVGAFPR